MLDRYIWGQVQRISPEAPVPVVQVTRESLHAGGAGNVVANIRALGGSVAACGTVGKDQAGRCLFARVRRALRRRQAPRRARRCGRRMRCPPFPAALRALR